MPNNKITEKTPLIPSAKTMEKNVNYTDIVPAEVMFLIFKRLTIKELAIAARVSKKWKNLADNDQVWRQKIVEEYPQYGEQDSNAELLGNENTFAPKKFISLSDIQSPKQALRDTLIAERKISEIKQLELKSIIKQKKEYSKFIYYVSGVAGAGACPTSIITYCLTQSLWQAFQNGLFGGMSGCMVGLVFEHFISSCEKESDKRKLEDVKNKVHNLSSNLLVEVTPKNLEMRL